MDSDRPPPPHRTASASSSTTTTTTSDLFICFTSRHHSSSSMKLSSKSILSPGRPGRDPPISLTTSLSRRLRTSRSIKGGASPAMFPTTAKKRSGGGFENAEPSSPKVTCIGQVRVKSKKKQAKKLRTLSRRHSSGDVSLRRLEHSRDGFNKSTSFGSNSFGSDKLPGNRNNQRWVHLPLTICEALRAFGSEFSCLFPCRSSCFSPEKEEKTSGGRRGSGSCAAVFTRWLVAFHDGDDGGGEREIELVVGDEEEESISIRRHVFDDLEIVNDEIEGSKDDARLSICIPPKNALLLMRCRSDPLKMEALSNRLWESTIGQNDEEDEEYVYKDEIQQKPVDFMEYSKGNDQETNIKQIIEEKEEEETQEQILESNDDEEMTFFGSLFEEIVENNELEDVREDRLEKETTEMVAEESKTQKVKGLNVEEMAERSETTDEVIAESKERENGVLEREGLPECLLLMMCEPKLSMEVSKETWVSSKDFVRRQSSRKKPPPPPPPPPPLLPVKPTNAQDESKVSATTTTTTLFTGATKSQKHVTAEAPAIQPRRSSCSLPAPPSMAEVLEQKLVNAVGYEPLVLTRCKSEPMRTAAAKLAPDTCFWKNRKLDPLRRATFGVGATGLGF